MRDREHQIGESADSSEFRIARTGRLVIEGTATTAWDRHAAPTPLNHLQIGRAVG